MRSLGGAVGCRATMMWPPSNPTKLNLSQGLGGDNSGAWEGRSGPRKKREWRAASVRLPIGNEAGGRGTGRQTGRIWIVVGRPVVSEHECGGLYGRRGRRRVHDADKTNTTTDRRHNTGRERPVCAAMTGGGGLCSGCVVLCSGWEGKTGVGWYVGAGTRGRNGGCRDTRGGRPSGRAGRQSQRNAKTTDAFSFAGGGGGGRRDEITWRPGGEGARKGGGNRRVWNVSGQMGGGGCPVCECASVCACVYVCECVGGLPVVPDLSWICVLLYLSVRDESVCRKVRQAVMVMMGWDGPMYRLLAGSNVEGPKYLAQQGKHK